jgi:hypothetical protein
MLAGCPLWAWRRSGRGSPRSLEGAETDPALHLFTDFHVRETIGGHENASTSVVDEVEDAVLGLKRRPNRRFDSLGAVAAFQKQLARCILDPDLDFHQAPFRSRHSAPTARVPGQANALLPACVHLLRSGSRRAYAWWNRAYAPSDVLSGCCADSCRSLGARTGQLGFGAAESPSALGSVPAREATNSSPLQRRYERGGGLAGQGTLGLQPVPRRGLGRADEANR